MTAIDRSSRRPASPVVLPLVASVGSPWDEWSTVTLPVVDVRVLDPDTVAFAAVGPVAVAPAMSGSVVSGSGPVMGRRSAVLPVGTVPSPRPRAVHIPAPRAADPVPTPVGPSRHGA